jgi:hypothetical protein
MSTATASEPMSAFQALGWQYMKATLLALSGLALVLAFVPRQVFQGELLVNVSQLITAHRPKLAADRVSLQRINPVFVEKFVISYAVLAGVAALTALLLSLHILVKTIRHSEEFMGPPIDTKIVLSGVVIISLCRWWCLFFPHRS